MISSWRRKCSRFAADEPGAALFKAISARRRETPGLGPSDTRGFRGIRVIGRVCALLAWREACPGPFSGSQSIALRQSILSPVPARRPVRETLTARRAASVRRLLRQIFEAPRSPWPLRDFPGFPGLPAGAFRWAAHRGRAERPARGQNPRGTPPLQWWKRIRGTKYAPARWFLRCEPERCGA